MDLADQAGSRWRTWQHFLRIVYGCAIGILVIMALMWIFLV